MGLFSSTKIYVSSSVRNLAGEEADRVQYLKTTVVGSMFGPNKLSMGDNIQNSFLKGPGVNLRNFFRWAENDYDLIGVPRATFGSNEGIDTTDIIPALSLASGDTALIQDTEVSPADFSFWAEQWMMVNHPSLLSSAWKSDYNETANNILVTFADATTASFTPANFNKTKTYLYVTYVKTRAGSGGALITEGPFMFIYEIGSGNAAIDAKVTQTVSDDRFFPFIPIRLDNKFLSTTFRPTEYELSKKAFKKSVGGDLDKLIEQIAGASSLPDIDYVYTVFGAAVNTRDLASRRYMFKFFKNVLSSGNASISRSNTWSTAALEWSTANELWLDWNYAQADVGSPLYGTAEPVVPPLPPKAASSIRVTATGTGSIPSNFDMQIQWQSMAYTVGKNLAKPTAKVGEVWFGEVTGSEINGSVWTSSGSMSARAKAMDRVRLYHQVSRNRWEAIDIVGMLHRNYIYKGKFVEISLREGLIDDEESGFIIPLHYPTFKDMSLVDSTQMATCCSYLVFNSYLVKKTGLLGSLFFKILLVAVFIAVIVIAPQLAPGLVKAATAIGTAIGLAGVAALIAGLAITAIASMIVTKLITAGAVAIFGEKFGAIFGAIVSFLAITVGGGLLNGQSLAAVWTNMGSASSLLALTNSVGQGVSGFISASIQEVGQKMEDFTRTIDQKMNVVNQAYADNLGYGNGMFDPMGLTDTTFGNGLESSTQFLSRTLLTGSDIAEISLGIISNMADMTLSTVLPIG